MRYKRYIKFYTPGLIHRPTVRHLRAARKYSGEGLSASVSGGEHSKRFVRKRAPVNNLTSRGVKGHGF